jgi:hypothetical protein
MIFDNVTHQFDDKFGRGARIINFSFSSELVTANTHPTRSAIAVASQFQSMCMVRSPKLIAGAIGLTLGNAPYGCLLPLLISSLGSTDLV